MKLIFNILKLFNILYGPMASLIKFYHLEIMVMVVMVLVLSIHGKNNNSYTLTDINQNSAAYLKKILELKY